jgi:hypothetical protein
VRIDGAGACHFFTIFHRPPAATSKLDFPVGAHNELYLIGPRSAMSVIDIGVRRNRRAKAR